MEDGGGQQNWDHDAKEAKENSIAFVDHSQIMATAKACWIVVPAHKRYSSNQDAQGPREHNHGYRASTGHHSGVRCVVNNGEITVEVHKEYVQYRDGEKGGYQRVSSKASVEAVQQSSASDQRKRGHQQSRCDVGSCHAAYEVIVKGP